MGYHNYSPCVMELFRLSERQEVWDTVIPYNKFTKEGTGFSFANYNAHEMKDAIARAVEVYKNKEDWRALIKTCMSQDFSWQHSAREYKALYEDMLRRFN